MEEVKIVFMGTPEFSVPVLETLIEKYRVIGVVSQPDKEVGRHKVLTPSPVKVVALKHNIKVLQPNHIRKEYQEILDLKPDLIITCAYGQIIPDEILNYPKYGCINVHGSLLPKLRGGAPIEHALIDGYSKTGITIMYMDSGMDTGDMITSQELEISDDDDLDTLQSKLSLIGRDLLLKTLPSIIAGTCQRIKQDETLVTYGYNIKRAEEHLDFNKTKREVFNKIRGLCSKPSANFYLDGEEFKVYASYISDITSTKENGTIIKTDKNGLWVKVSDGVIVLTTIKPFGKNKMQASDFINGYHGDLVGKVLK